MEVAAGDDQEQYQSGPLDITTGRSQRSKHHESTTMFPNVRFDIWDVGSCSSDRKGVQRFLQAGKFVILLSHPP
jgi:hypothetical protein